MRETDASLVSCLVAALVFFDKFTISLATLQAAALLYVLEFRFSFFFWPVRSLFPLGFGFAAQIVVIQYFCH